MATAKDPSASHPSPRNHHPGSPGTTPPDREVRLPPSPPATAERCGRSSDVERLAHELEEYRRQAETGDIAPYVEVAVSRQQYKALRETLERSFRRFDWEPANGRVFLRMPSPIHDGFSEDIGDYLRDQLTSIANKGGQAGEFASRIKKKGNSRIYLKEQEPECQGDPIHRQPDQQFQHKRAVYPGLVVEVSYSQDGKNLRKLAQDYILYSNGSIKVVLGIDLNYRGKLCTVSTWRPKVTRSEDGGEVLETEQVISQLPFRSSDGQALNQDRCLSFNLVDFARGEATSGCRQVSISIRLDVLFSFITEAEEFQQAREDEISDIGPAWKERSLRAKRKFSSSPVEELRSDDAKRFEDLEDNAAERTEALDEDFQPDEEFRPGENFRPRPVRRRRL